MRGGVVIKSNQAGEPSNRPAKDQLQPLVMDAVFWNARAAANPLN